MKKWKKCDRCKEEYESVYLVPYVTQEFIDVKICRKCSMDFHDKIKEFTKSFLRDHMFEAPIDHV